MHARRFVAQRMDDHSTALSSGRSHPALRRPLAASIVPPCILGQLARDRQPQPEAAFFTGRARVGLP
jgi:hypothetical protein